MRPTIIHYEEEGFTQRVIGSSSARIGAVDNLASQQLRWESSWARRFRPRGHLTSQRR